ncbi:hypothetical protein [Planctomycetes bacterium K23_9]|uniref:Uncharacterized protein n=1 Tax=Stieleria marina TaxID=1930275 RepID=A0A517P1G8_9BACT|nr:hypothetical protein K239x_52390 [Planctomycetes bacterium K23_9]
MAVRLNVIMVHSPPAKAGAQQLAEDVVGELIGRPGIDVTLVGSLDQAAATSTDMLTMESISSDVAVLDWRSPEQLMETLAKIEFGGDRCRHAEDQEAAPSRPGSRKIYAFDLRRFSDAKLLCTSLQSLLATRQIKTVSIGGLGTALVSSGQSAGDTPESVSVRQSAASPATSVPEQVSGDQNGHQAGVPIEPKDHGIAPDSPNDRRGKSSGKPPVDLDDLVDQLDLLDP